jgi:hypothetical protein
MLLKSNRTGGSIREKPEPDVTAAWFLNWTRHINNHKNPFNWTVFGKNRVTRLSIKSVHYLIEYISSFLNLRWYRSIFVFLRNYFLSPFSSNGKEIKLNSEIHRKDEICVSTKSVICCTGSNLISRSKIKHKNLERRGKLRLR